MSDPHSVRISDLRNAAQLARLDLAEDEALALCGEVARILEHFTTLQAVPVTGVEPYYTAFDASEDRSSADVRPDEVQASLPRAAWLDLAPNARAGEEFLRVPKAIGDAL